MGNAIQTPTNMAITTTTAINASQLVGSLIFVPHVGQCQGNGHAAKIAQIGSQKPQRNSVIRR